MHDEIAHDLNHQGFHVCPDFLQAATCDRLKALLEGLASQDIVHNEDRDFHGGNTVLAPNIITHSVEFMDLVQDPRLLLTASRYFEYGAFPGEKDPFQLHLMHARMVGESAPAQELHIDSRLCGVDPPLVLHVFFYLDDCLGDGAGATRIVPGSHRIKRYSTPEDNAAAVSVFERKGTAIFINSNTFHGSSQKTSPGTRWVLTVAYSRWWMRQPFAIPYFTGWPRNLTEREMALFGFNNYADKNRSDRGLSSRGPRPVMLPID